MVTNDLQSESLAIADLVIEAVHLQCEGKAYTSRLVFRRAIARARMAGFPEWAEALSANLPKVGKEEE
jgi:hypothetical protein